LADLAAFEDSPAFSELEKRVLRYTVALTRTPAEVPEELFNSLREHFNPQQMVELTTAPAQALAVAQPAHGPDVVHERRLLASRQTAGAVPTEHVVRSVRQPR
jgi:alkylhydroperoxidase family enzyme